MRKSSAFIRTMVISIGMLLLLGLMPASSSFAASNTGKCGENVTYEYDADSKTLTIRGQGRMYDYTTGVMHGPDVPPGPVAPYSSFGETKYIVIEDGVTYIGDYAFLGLGRAETLTLGKDVASIGSAVFSTITNVSEIIVSASNSKYSSLEGCLYNKAGTVLIRCPLGMSTEVVIPEKVLEVSAYAFQDCEKLNKITLGSKVSKIGQYAFRRSPNLEGIYFTGSREQWEAIERANDGLDSKVLVYCKNDGSGSCGSGLTWSHCYDTLTISGSGQMNDYETGSAPWADSTKQVRNVKLGKGVKDIGNGTFAGCSNLSEVSLPSQITRIGVDAFRGCSSLTAIVIPDTVTSVGAGAFCGCNHMTSVKLSKGLISIGDSAFQSCSWLKEISLPTKLRTIGAHAFERCSIESITFPSSLETIGEAAFKNSSVAKVENTESVRSIGKEAFRDTNLTQASFDGATAVGSLAFSGSRIRFISLRNVKTIGQYAFYYTPLATICFSDSLRSVGNYAFYPCTTLTDVYFGGSENDWKNVSVGAQNGSLKEAVFHFAAWHKDGHGWWYGDGGGWYAADCWKLIDGKWYYFNSKGYLLTGWQNLSGKWYYLNANGAMQTGWKKLSGKWYYFGNSGAMTIGWQKIDGNWYYFSAGGAMQTGWVKIDGKTYYFKSSGCMAANEWCEGYWLSSDGTWTYTYKAEWKKDNTGWWFGDNSGWYARNETLVIDGISYTFDFRGYLV